MEENKPIFAIQRLGFEHFKSFPYDDPYDKSQFRKYQLLTDDQLKKIELLKEMEGSTIEYMRGKKPTKMVIAFVSLDLKERSKCGSYSSYPYQVRLNYADGKVRAWDGFWTTNVDKIIINP